MSPDSAQAAPNASIVIPNYNGADYLPALIDSIRKQTARDFEVIIVDDCSPDPRTRTVLDEIEKGNGTLPIAVWRNPANVGYAKNANRGIALARGKFICLLNNDTVLAPTFVEKCTSALGSRTDLGAVSPVITDERGATWFSGGRFQNGEIENLCDDFTGIREADWIAGTAPFFRREVFERAGLLSESFGMYHEDVELACRIREKTGFKLGMLSDKLVLHHLSRTEQTDADAKGARLLYYRPRNHLLLVRRYAPGNVGKTVRKYLGELKPIFRDCAARPHPRRIAATLRHAGIVAGAILSGLFTSAG